VVNPSQSCQSNSIPFELHLKIKSKSPFAVGLGKLSLDIKGYKTSSESIDSDILSIKNMKFSQGKIKKGESLVIGSSAIEFKDYKTFAQLADNLVRFQSVTILGKAQVTLYSYIYGFPIPLWASISVQVSPFSERMFSGILKNLKLNFPELKAAVDSAQVTAKEKLEVDAAVKLPVQSLALDVWVPQMRFKVKDESGSVVFLVLSVPPTRIQTGDVVKAQLSVFNGNPITTQTFDKYVSFGSNVSHGSSAYVSLDLKQDNTASECAIHKVLDNLPVLSLDVLSLWHWMEKSSDSSKQSFQTKGKFRLDSLFFNLELSSPFASVKRITTDNREETQSALSIRTQVDINVDSSFQFDVPIPKTSILLTSVDELGSEPLFKVLIETHISSSSKRQSIVVDLELLDGILPKLPEFLSDFPKLYETLHLQFLKGESFASALSEINPWKIQEIVPIGAKSSLRSLLRDLVGPIKISSLDYRNSVVFRVETWISSFIFPFNFCNVPVSVPDLRASLVARNGGESLSSRAYVYIPNGIMIELGSCSETLSQPSEIKFDVRVDATLEHASGISQVLASWFFGSGKGSIAVHSIESSQVQLNFFHEFSAHKSKNEPGMLEILIGSSSDFPLHLQLRQNDSRVTTVPCSFLLDSACSKPVKNTNIQSSFPSSLELLLDLPYSEYPLPVDVVLDLKGDGAAFTCDLLRLNNILRINAHNIEISASSEGRKLRVRIGGGLRLNDAQLPEAVDSILDGIYGESLTSIDLLLHFENSINVLSSMLSNFTGRVASHPLHTVHAEPVQNKISMSYHATDSSESALEVAAQVQTSLGFLWNWKLDLGDIFVRVSSQGNKLIDVYIDDTLVSGGSSVSNARILLADPESLDTFVDIFSQSARSDAIHRAPLQVEIKGPINLRFDLDLSAHNLILLALDKVSGLREQVVDTEHSVVVKSIQTILDSILSRPMKLITDAIKGAIFQRTGKIPISFEISLWNPSNLTVESRQFYTDVMFNDPDGVPKTKLVLGSPYGPASSVVFASVDQKSALVLKRNVTRPLAIEGSIDMSNTLKYQSLARLYNEFFTNDRLCLALMTKLHLNIFSGVAKKPYPLRLRLDLQPFVKLLFTPLLPDFISERISKPCPYDLACVSAKTNVFSLVNSRDPSLSKIGQATVQQRLLQARSLLFSGNGAVLSMDMIQTIDDWETLIRFTATSSESEADGTLILAFQVETLPSNGKYDSSSALGFSNHVHLSSGKVTSRSTLSTDCQHRETSSHATLVDRQEHEMMIRYDGTSQEMSVFLDGSLTSSCKVKAKLDSVLLHPTIAFERADPSLTLKVSSWEVLSAKLDPSSTVLERDGEELGIAQQQFTLKILGRNSCLNPRRSGGDKVSAKIQAVSGGRAIKATQVRDEADGSYTASFVAPAAGSYNLIIEVPNQKEAAIGTFSIRR